jgi:hypothetical protein
VRKTESQYSSDNSAADHFTAALRVNTPSNSREDASNPTPVTRREREREAIEFERWDGMS